MSSTDTAAAPAAVAAQPEAAPAVTRAEAPLASAVTTPRIEVAPELSEAQRRAAEQRVAAERALQEAVALEARLAEEAEQARTASERAFVTQLATALDQAILMERNAADLAASCVKKVDRAAAQRTQAEALKVDDQTARHAAADDVTATEMRLAEARRRLEMATAACSESMRRYSDVRAVEEAALAEAARADQLIATRRHEREALEAELHAAQERVAALDGSARPALAAEPAANVPVVAGDVAASEAARRVAERRAADAARRIAERRAADAQQSAAS